MVSPNLMVGRPRERSQAHELGLGVRDTDIGLMFDAALKTAPPPCPIHFAIRSLTKGRWRKKIVAWNAAGMPGILRGGQEGKQAGTPKPGGANHPPEQANPRQLHQKTREKTRLLSREV